MAAVWRSVCGVMFLLASDGQVRAARAAWWAIRCWSASRLRGLPCRVGNSGSVGLPARSVSQTRRTATVPVPAVSGMMRSLRPLPWQLTCAPTPRWTSAQVSAVSSEARRPVWAASRSRAWSRRPVQVVGSGLASSASTSSSVRKVTMARSDRFDGMARTRWMSAACSGWRSAANRNREWIAARRRCGSVWCCPGGVGGGPGTRRSAGRPGRRCRAGRPGSRSGSRRRRAAAAACPGRRRWCGGWPGADGRAGR